MMLHENAFWTVFRNILAFRQKPVVNWFCWESYLCRQDTVKMTLSTVIAATVSAIGNCTTNLFERLCFTGHISSRGWLRPHRCQRLRTRKLRQMSGLTALYLPLLTRIACRRLRTMKLRQVSDLADVYLLDILFIARMACPHRCQRLRTRNLRKLSVLMTLLPISFSSSHGCSRHCMKYNKGLVFFK